MGLVRSVSKESDVTVGCRNESKDSQESNFLALLGAVGCTLGIGQEENRKPLFDDIVNMKDRVRQALTRPVYNVHDFYKTDGCCQRIARSSIFETVTLLIITLNAGWIAVDTEFNGEPVLVDAHPLFQVTEHLFCLYFTFEWSVRFWSFRHWQYCVRDAWFVFDTGLVSTMVAETWVMSFVILVSSRGGSTNLADASILRIGRMLRLMRMARMARLLRAMPELMILIKGMAAAARSVFFTLCLLIIILYVFGVAFMQLTRDTTLGQKRFDSVFGSMYTLLLAGTFMDNIGIVAGEIGEEGKAFAVLFFLFVLLASLTVMNMLIGVICEVVSAVAATEREEMTVGRVKCKLQEIVGQVDEDNDYMISRKEFMGILENREAAATLQDVGVDVVNLIDFADAIFDSFDSTDQNQHLTGFDLEETDAHRRHRLKRAEMDARAIAQGEDPDPTISFTHFMEEVLRLRGSNGATVKDVVDLQKFVKRGLADISEQMDRNARRILGELVLLAPQRPARTRRQSDPSALPRRRSESSVSGLARSRRSALVGAASLGQLGGRSHRRPSRDHFSVSSDEEYESESRGSASRSRFQAFAQKYAASMQLSSVDAEPEPAPQSDALPMTIDRASTLLSDRATAVSASRKNKRHHSRPDRADLFRSASNPLPTTADAQAPQPPAAAARGEREGEPRFYAKASESRSSASSDQDSVVKAAQPPSPSSAAAASFATSRSEAEPVEAAWAALLEEALASKASIVSALRVALARAEAAEAGGGLGACGGDPRLPAPADFALERPGPDDARRACGARGRAGKGTGSLAGLSCAVEVDLGVESLAGVLPEQLRSDSGLSEVKI